MRHNENLLTAEEERKACAKVCRDKKPWGNSADDWAAKCLEEAAVTIEQRSNGSGERGRACAPSARPRGSASSED